VITGYLGGATGVGANGWSELGRELSMGSKWPQPVTAARASTQVRWGALLIYLRSAGSVPRLEINSISRPV
jgi:hypothetical protein